MEAIACQVTDLEITPVITNVPPVSQMGELSDDELVTAWITITDGFARTQHRLAADLERSANLPASSFEVLLRLLRSPAHRLPMHSIVAASSMTSGGMTKLADRMVDAGLVERQDADDDRRITMLALTADGSAAAKRAVRDHIAALREHVLGRISVAEIGALAETMGELRQSSDANEANETA